MTTTSTTDLAGILSAKKAEIVGGTGYNPEHEGVVTVIGPLDSVDQTTGEIVPGTAVETSPIAPAVPAPVEVRYPEVPPKVVGGLPYIRDYVKLARTIDQTEMVPVAFRGRYDAITAAFMRGYEMGLGPMQALDSFNVIQGKVGLTAEAMRALILNAGHDIILTDVPGLDRDSETVIACRAECHRKNWPADKWATYTYTLEDARTAGLLGKDSWKKNPRAMLDARATSGAGRRYFADVLAGMSYTPEEIRDFSGPEQEVTPSPPTPHTQAAPSLPEPSPVDTPAPSADPPTSTTATSSSSEQTPPKRPRGRPRKAPTAPIDAPGPSALEPTSSSVPASTTAPALSILPEQTSLNTDGAIPEVAQPGEAGIIREQLKVLAEMIKSLPVVQQPLCRAFIRQHYPDGTADLKPVDVQKCIDIAAGWPESAAQHPIADELPF